MVKVSNDEFSASLRSRFLVGDRRPRRGDRVHRSNVEAVSLYLGGLGARPFDGARFESYSPNTAEEENLLTAGDVTAVTLLSMEIRRESRSGISTAHLLAIEDRALDISRLLQQLPTDRDLHSLSDTEFDRLLGEDSPGRALWSLLRQQIGMHRVATFKLLARKRPRLCAIADSRTEAALGSVDDWWRAWHLALRSSDELVGELESVRSDAAQNARSAAGLSLLRVADIVLWDPRRSGR